MSVPAVAERPAEPAGTPLLLLSFVLVAFAANSLITRHVVDAGLLDAGLLSAVRFISGALALAGLALARREHVVVAGRTCAPRSSVPRQ